jgi:hypothetical protein
MPLTQTIPEPDSPMTARLAITQTIGSKLLTIMMASIFRYIQGLIGGGGHYVLIVMSIHLIMPYLNVLIAMNITGKALIINIMAFPDINIKARLAITAIRKAIAGDKLCEP